eukprot:GDKI01002103.1.p1 GENE.GDKI01002103.1~~GDKI01002103.1.p1  ORF type:complete len:314 (-),score=52.06 GDKI01002103.1:31-972(-)
MSANPQHRVAIVIGASRGIGRQIALSLAVKGNISIVVAAKSVTDNPTLPGTIDSVCEEIHTLTRQVHTHTPLQDTVHCTAVRCDVRDEKSIVNLVQHTLHTYGRVDFVIYNAGSIHWGDVAGTSVKKFDLMHSINARGFYCTVQHVLPLMLQQSYGRIIALAPPIYSRFFKGKTAYAMTKVGMSVCVMGLSHELNEQHKGKDVAVGCIWPATGVQSAVTDKLKTSPALLRTSHVTADAVVCALYAQRESVNGKCLIDEDFLRSEMGYTDNDFIKYRLDPSTEPPRMMPKHFPDLRVAEEMQQGVFDKNTQAKL